MKWFFLSLLVLSVMVGCQDSSTTNRQQAVAQIGAEVMPFDLDRSTHVFEKTDSGGVQHVVSDDRDAEQVGLIQTHLQEIAQRFSAGNFHDPQSIHGAHMPGLHDLVEGHDRIEIRYQPLELGGQITYATEDEALIESIHQWFDAQVSDHGEHARH